jgi:hypothetical protein
MSKARILIRLLWIVKTSEFGGDTIGKNNEFHCVCAPDTKCNECAPDTNCNVMQVCLEMLDQWETEVCQAHWDPGE